MYRTRNSVGWLVSAFVLALVISLFAVTLPAFADTTPPAYVPGELIVKFKSGQDVTGAFTAKHKINSSKKLLDLVKQKSGKGKQAFLNRGADRLQVLSFSDTKSISAKIAELTADPAVEYAEPNYIVSVDATPNDPNYSQQWDLNNTGQTGGAVDADIDAPEGWDTSTGSAMVVGIIDTGIDYTHPDLAANMWHNPGEIPGNGIDDDGNGYVDDVYGWNFINNTPNVMDDYGHGTHVAGTIAGVGDNGVGIAGINWHGKVAALKFLSAGGSGTTEDAVKAIQYATAMGFKITNNSWGGSEYSQALYDAISAANDAGDLFVAAAGNSSLDADKTPMYPAAYTLPNIISVAATDNTDALAYFSNFGNNSVDMGAPGVNVYSTVPTGSCTLCDASGYKLLSGTSMASPHVAGAAALLWGLNPALSGAQIKDVILSTSEAIPSLVGKTLTAGRLNMGNFFTDLTDSTPPSAVGDLAAGAAGQTTVSLSWSATGDDGMTGTARRYDVRYSTSPITDANFNSATPTGGAPIPAAPGSSQSFIAQGLQPTSSYYFALKVLDNRNNASLISNNVTATTLVNHAPVADAGPDASGFINTFIYLNGTNTFDADGEELFYKWDYGYGWSGGLGINNLNFIAENPGVYPIVLTVTDPAGATSSDTVIVTVADPAAAHPPVANAGPDLSGVVGQYIVFNGSGSSDPDNNISTYKWNYGDGNSATSYGSSNMHSYTAAGTYTALLTVTDTLGATATDTTIVTVGPNAAPVANAGPDKTCYTGVECFFDGSGSHDAEGPLAWYMWTFTEEDVQMGTTSSHTYTTPGTYTVALRVSDTANLTGNDTAVVTVTNPPPPNTPPVANAGPDFAVQTGTTMSFSGTLSQDAEGPIAAYLWNFGDGVSTTTMNPTHFYGMAGIFTVRLTVTDQGGLMASDTAIITVNNPPDTTSPSAPSNLTAVATTSTHAVLNWSASTDNVGVAGYKVYRNSSLLASTTLLNFNDLSVTASTAYTYVVKAYDAAGNVSASSTPANITIPAPPDTTAPSVSITSPANNATVSATTTINASASDNVGVTKIEFYLDASSTPFATDLTSPYSASYNTKLLANGTHIFKAKAYDAAGNASTTQVSVNVQNDLTLPTVSITSPANGANVTHSNNITISATASDNVGVTKVEFYVAGALKCTDTTSTYSCVWAVPAAKNIQYALIAKAYDAAGNVKTSATSTVTSR